MLDPAELDFPYKERRVPGWKRRGSAIVTASLLKRIAMIARTRALRTKFSDPVDYTLINTRVRATRDCSTTSEPSA